MNMMNQMAARKEKGFTLIELVMVIVILGILAAFALPRFADLGGEARVATMEGAIGSVKSAASIAHSACLARAACDADGTGQSVDLDGTPVDMENGYPAADSGGIDVAAQIDDDFILSSPTGTAPNRTVLISADDGDGSALEDCEFEYNEEDGSISNEDLSGC